MITRSKTGKSEWSGGSTKSGGSDLELAPPPLQPNGERHSEISGIIIGENKRHSASLTPSKSSESLASLVPSKSSESLVPLPQAPPPASGAQPAPPPVSPEPEGRSRVSSVGDKLYIKVSFPWADGSGGVYKIKRFEMRATVLQASQELNSHLREPYLSDRNKLYFNGQPLEDSRALNSFNFGPNDVLFFKRDPLYELSISEPSGKNLILEPNIKVGEGIKKIAAWLFGKEMEDDGTRSMYSHYKLSKRLKLPTSSSSNKFGASLRLMEQKHLSDYGIKKKDVLEFAKLAKREHKGNRAIKFDDDGDDEDKADKSDKQDTAEEDVVYAIVVEDAPVTADDKEEEAQKAIDIFIKAEKPPEKAPDSPTSPSSPSTTPEQTPKKKKSLRKESSSMVGSPYNVIHRSHVDFEYKWSGFDVDQMFDLKEKLGQGGYGAVFRAQHRETGFALAIKVLALNGPGRADLQKEIDVLKKCRCPNVLSYYGSFSRNNEIWILMDHCAVGSVKDLMKTCVETLDEEQIAMVTKQVILGLSYLHAKGIVHMDVKAANILLTEEGQVKMADFGVSQQLQSVSGQSDILIGSPLWMAPEVILRNPYNFKADTWSLGVTIIEMAEGRPPNRGIKSLEGLSAIPNLPPPTVQNPRAWSPTFLDFLSKCLVKDPNDRPAAMDLLGHPFIEDAKGPDVLEGLIKQCLSIKTARVAAEQLKALQLANPAT